MSSAGVQDATAKATTPSQALIRIMWAASKDGIGTTNSIYRLGAGREWAGPGMLIRGL